MSRTDPLVSDADPARAPTAFPESTPQRRRLGYFALALLAYVPPLISHPGQVAADTKQYLYLDPSRLLARAPSMWDPNIGLGTVTHQNIGYLFPMGPYYWLLNALRVPDWIAQRLWLGTLIFFAGLGVLYLLRTLGIRGPGVAIAALAYMFSPYSLDYAARISVLLMPWAALGWMIALTIKALRDGRWRYPALFALVVQVVGGVNATALIFAGIGPVLWIVYSCVTGEVPVRRALTVTAKIAGLTVLTSLWWIAGLWAQGSYGLDILKYTETVKAVARTSTPNEVLRGLGYWFFYGRDRVGPWTEASIDYTQHSYIILAGYGLATLSLLGAAIMRWRHRAYFLALMFIGVVIAVGAYPYKNPTPLGALFKAWAKSSAAGLALRSTGRAIPLVTLAMAILLGMGINAVVARLSTTQHPRRALAVVGLVLALLVIDFPALYNGTYYGRYLLRPESIPSYWKQAARYLDSGSHSTRVLELPGSDFAAYTWGNTVDPITPGLMDRPYVARELIPWGGPNAQDLLNAVDRRFQEGVYEPAGFAALARRMGIGAIDLRYDLEFKRYDLVAPLNLESDFENVPGLSLAKVFGPKLHGAASAPYVNEQSLAVSPNVPTPRSVAIYNIDHPTAILRAESDQRPLVVAGNGEGLIDVANIGLLDNSGVVVYSGSYANRAAELRKVIGPNGVLVVTDSNRKRGRRWSDIRDNTGYTEQAGEKPLVYDPSDSRLDEFPGAGDDAYTLTEQRGVKSIQATAYGNPISYTPDDRPALAVDGDVDTSWNVAAFDLAIGNRIQVTTAKPITTDRVNLVQKQNGPQDRWITKIRMTFDGGRPVEKLLDTSSRVHSGQTILFPKRTFSKFEITITNTSDGPRVLNGGAAAVGFGEIRLHGVDGRPVRVSEVVRMPRDLLMAEGRASGSHALVLVMSRARGLPVPPRADEERSMSRSFTLPTSRAFSFTGTARLTPDAKGKIIDGALGIPPAAEGGIDVQAREFLAGCVQCRSDNAIDGDHTTAWVTPFIGVRRQWVDYLIPKPITFDHANLQIIADENHSRPTLLQLTVDGQVRWITLPDLPVQKQKNGLVPVAVKFPAVTGRHIRVKIAQIDEVRTPSQYAKRPVLAPVGIAELGIPGLQAPATPASLPGTCRSDLLRVDNRAVPVRITGSATDAEALKPLTISTCDPADPTARPPLALGAGDHVLQTTAGELTALELDRLVLASAPGGGVGTTDDGRVTGLGAPVSAPKLTVVHTGRTKMQVKVTGASGPFWVVLGQSQNAGWRANVKGGAALGGSQLVDGYANGWRIDPKGKQTLVVNLEWVPQQRVRLALFLSVLGGLLCCAIAAVGFRRARRSAVAVAATTVDATPIFAWPWLPAGEPVSLRAQVLTILAAGAIGSVVIDPWAGVLAAVFLLAAFRVPRARAALVLAPAVLVGAVGLYMSYRQSTHVLPAVFEWPNLFPRATTPAWAAIALFAADALYELVRRGRRRPDP